LAPQTVSTLKGLKEKVRAIGFLPSTDAHYDQVQQYFERYHREAPDKFEYVFRDPRKNPDLAAKYQLKEGQTTVVLTRGEGSGEAHTALNVIAEQELTNALVKINAVGEQKVYFVVGHGEWPLDAPAPGPAQSEQGISLSELKKSLQQEGYAAETLNLVGKEEVPKDAALVVIAGGRSKFTPAEVATLKKYLDQGGRVLFFTDANVEAGLDKLLAEYGVQIDNGIVADDRFSVQSPYVVISMFYGDHEITRILKQMQMNVEFPTARGLTALREGTAAGVKAEAAVVTAPFAW